LKPLLQDLCEHVRASCTKGDSNADLTPALRNHVGEHTVSADRC
jgi:hypothetical protein